MSVHQRLQPRAAQCSYFPVLGGFPSLGDDISVKGGLFRWLLLAWKHLKLFEDTHSQNTASLVSFCLQASEALTEAGTAEQAGRGHFPGSDFPHGCICPRFVMRGVQVSSAGRGHPGPGPASLGVFWAKGCCGLGNKRFCLQFLSL